MTTVRDFLSEPRDPSGYSSSDLISMGFIATPALAALLTSTRAAAEIDVGRYDAIVIAGGQAPVFTMADATAVHRKFVEFYEAGKIAAALCHGTSVLRYARLQSGALLVAGKTVTGFANSEEDFADQAVWSMKLVAPDVHVMPWRIENELKNR